MIKRGANLHDFNAELEEFSSRAAEKRIIDEVTLESDIEKSKVGISELENKLRKDQDFEKKCNKVINGFNDENRAFNKEKKRKSLKANKLETEISTLRLEKSKSLTALGNVKRGESELLRSYQVRNKH